MFLVGESAHVNPPWGGHGFNTSVGDAVNIAWKIAAVEQRLGAARPAGQLRGRAARRRRADGRQRRGPTCAAWPATCPPTPPPSSGPSDPSSTASAWCSVTPTRARRSIQPGAAAAAARPPTTYTPVAEPGARLPHAWLPDGTSLYDRLGRGFTLVGPAARGAAPGRPRPRARHPAHGR